MRSFGNGVTYRIYAPLGNGVTYRIHAPYTVRRGRYSANALIVATADRAARRDTPGAPQQVAERHSANDLFEVTPPWTSFPSSRQP